MRLLGIFIIAVCGSRFVMSLLSFIETFSAWDAIWAILGLIATGVGVSLLVRVHTR